MAIEIEMIGGPKCGEVYAITDETKVLHVPYLPPSKQGNLVTFKNTPREDIQRLVYRMVVFEGEQVRTRSGRVAFEFQGIE